MKFFIATIFAVMGIIGFAQAQKSEKDKEAAPPPTINHGQEKVHEHGKEEVLEHGHGHGHEEVERRNVGPDKGVLEANEDIGFKLREGVEERFGIKSQQLSSEKPGNMPEGAIVYSKEDYQVFRKRNGFWKPVTVKAARKGDLVSVESKELKTGDLIAVNGTGFLKLVELSVFGPAIEGHIH